MCFVQGFLKNSLFKRESETFFLFSVCQVRGFTAQICIMTLKKKQWFVTFVFLNIVYIMTNTSLSKTFNGFSLFLFEF